MLRLFGIALLLSAPLLAQDLFPVSVWYGGGKARAPMVSRDPAAEREEWRKDLRQIRELGFNTVRMWVDWATSEPRRGEFRFDQVDQMLELAEQAGLRVIIQMYTDSAPEWLGARYADASFVTHTGMRIGSQAAPGYCLDHPGVRSDLSRFVTALAARAKNSKAFYAWDLWSEPHIVNWVWMNYPVDFCYCQHTQARLREWLKSRYGTLEKLNASWYRTFEDWSQVEAPRYGTILSYTDLMDWKAFIADKIEGDLKLRADAVRRARADFITTSHSDVPGVLTSPLSGWGNGDDWQMFRPVNYYGTSLYPKHASSTAPWAPERLAMAMAGTWSASRGRGFYVGELQAGQGATGVKVAEPVTGNDLRLWALSAIAYGARAINYYAYYPMSSGYESNGYGMIELDGKITPRAREAGALAKAVHQNAPLILGAKPRAAEVAIVYNPLAYMTGGNTVAPGQRVREALQGHFKAFWERSIPAEFLHVDDVAAGRFAGYRIVFLPYPLMLPAAAAARLKDFVAAGGTLVSEARPAWNDERGFANLRIPGAGLDEVFGAREALLRSPESTEFTYAGEKVPGGVFEEHLEPYAGTEVLATFAGGQPAVTRARYGKGTAVLVGTFLAPGRPAAGRFLTALAEAAGVRPPLDPSNPAVDARTLVGPGYRLVFLLNPTDKPQPVKAALGSSGREVLSGRNVTGVWEGTVPARDAIWLELRP